MKLKTIVSGLFAMLLAFAASVCCQTEKTVSQTAFVQQVVAAPSAPNSLSAQMWKAMERVGFPSVSPDDVVLNRMFYRMAFSTKHCEAKWVMWALTPDMLDAQGKRCAFVTDNTLPGYDYQVEKSDYDDSGYSRGHMMPAADCRFSAKASEECAYMSNVCPQSFRLNSGAWNALEMRCREWTRVEDTLFIVCGPVYYSKEPRKIGRTHRLDVPDAFFKVVLSTRKGHEKMLGFVMANTEAPAKMRESVCSVAAIEDETGIVFFPHLDQKLKEQLDLSANYFKWKTPKQQNRSYNGNNYYRKPNYNNRNGRGGAAKKPSGNW